MSRTNRVCKATHQKFSTVSGNILIHIHYNVTYEIPESHFNYTVVLQENSAKYVCCSYSVK